MIVSSLELHEELVRLSSNVQLDRKIEYKKVNVFLSEDMSDSIFFIVQYRGLKGLNHLEKILGQNVAAIVICEEDFISSREVLSKFRNINIYVVKSVDGVLKKLILIARNRIHSKVYVIWGSTGKTQVSKMLNFTTKSVFKVGSNLEYLNNLYGIFQCFYSITGDEDYLFIEIGAQKKFELKEMVEYIRPNYAVLTSIQNCHLATLLNFDNIVEFKSEVFTIDSLKVVYLHEDEFYRIDNRYKTTGITFKVLKNQKNVVVKQKTPDMINESLVKFILSDIDKNLTLSEDYPRTKYGFKIFETPQIKLAYNLRTSSFESFISAAQQLKEALHKIDILVITTDDNWGEKKSKFLKEIGILLSDIDIDRIYYFGSDSATFTYSYAKHSGKALIFETIPQAMLEDMLSRKTKLTVGIISQWTYAWTRKLVDVLAPTSEL